MARIVTRPATPAENEILRAEDVHYDEYDGTCGCAGCCRARRITNFRSIASDPAHPLHAEIRPKWESGTY